jgi:hypothetical protein
MYNMYSKLYTIIILDMETAQHYKKTHQCVPNVQGWASLPPLTTWEPFTLVSRANEFEKRNVQHTVL